MVRRHPRGFTLIETLVTIAIMALLAALVAPSFSDYLLTQRLKSIHAQLVTDVNFARSEAVTRNNFARIAFRDDDPDQTCYTVFINPPGVGFANRCNCNLGPGAACNFSGNTGSVEIRTVQVPRSTGVTVTAPGNSAAGTNPFPAIGFSNLHGGLLNIPTDQSASPATSFQIQTAASASKALKTVLGRNGRPTACAVGNNLGAPACP